MYDDQALRYCLEDGAPLHPTHPKAEQDAQTVLMQAHDQTESDTAAIPKFCSAENFDTRCELVVESILRFIGKQPFSMGDIFNLAPRFMTRGRVEAVVASLIELDMLRKITHSETNIDLYFIPSFEQKVSGLKLQK